MNRFASIFAQKERRSRIWRIALPIMGGMMSQNVLNLVDIGMVGRLGDKALAATGIGAFTSYLAISVIVGLSAGVQALAARRLGQERFDETAVPLNGGLILSLLIGLPLGLCLIVVAPWAFGLLTADADVAALGTPYLQIRMAAIIAVGINFSFRGYWSAIHMAGVYLRTLLLMHTLNIFLNWVLIFGNLGAPALGVFGAGLATTISLYFGSALYFVFAFRHARDKGFLQGLPSRNVLWQQFKLSLPASIQQFFFAAGLVTLVWIVGKIGTAEVAAVNVLMTFQLTALLPAFGFALAAATLVGNALGRGDTEEAERWGWNAATLTAMYGVLVCVTLIALARPILGVFLTNPDTLELAYLPTVLWALAIPFDTMGMVLMNGLMGAGDTRRSMWITVIAQWGFFLPLAYLVGPVLGFGLLGIWVLNGIYRAGQALVFAQQWHSRKWAGIDI